MYFNVEVFERDTIAEVAIQAVGLFHQDDAASLVIAQESNHFAEMFPSRYLGGFHVHKFAQDAQLMILCILAEEFELCRN
ncbi:MAG: hypothetical protein WCC21_16495 [Candidatus Acidiferrales bacterium]